MFKLLTEEKRIKMAREYATRRMVVLLLAFIAVLVIGVAGLLPSYVLSGVEYEETLELSRISGEREDSSEFQAWLERITLELKTLSPNLDADRPSVEIEKIIGQKVDGISLTNFSWIKDRRGNFVFTVGGVAADRMTLIAFENRIASSGHFSSVSLPVSNLTMDRNIDFQIKFSATMPNRP